MAYKAKFWDGTQWVDLSSSITDVTAFATQEDLNNLTGDSDQFIIPMQVFR